ncbi:hypothetical protein GCM10023311_27780 [Flaviramulus aquimarinus]|uniref:Cytochrome c domain-containing protein n=1 Tax=Flaviramulus aquimarinus TaxID=1170456 RepID=A0ABP9FNR4_9FLAO
MKFKNLICVLVISVLLFNCSSDSNDDLIPQEEEEMNPSPNALTYDADIKSIFSNNCTQCHGSTPTNGAPTSYVTYAQVVNSINSIISRINNASNPMPQGGLMSQALRDDIQQWKDDGLLEN